MLSSALAWVSGLLLLGSPPPHRSTGVGRLAAAPAPSVSMTASASSLAAPAVVPPLPVPPLNVVMLLVGTLGDLLPFMAIARQMVQEHGHTVRHPASPSSCQTEHASSVAPVRPDQCSLRSPPPCSARDQH